MTHEKLLKLIITWESRTWILYAGKRCVRHGTLWLSNNKTTNDSTLQTRRNSAFVSSKNGFIHPLAHPWRATVPIFTFFFFFHSFYAPRTSLIVEGENYFSVYIKCFTDSWPYKKIEPIKIHYLKQKIILHNEN